MISKKRLMSVAAALAISSVAVTADYLPLTSDATDNKWVMFGVTGFHANGATVAAGGTDAGMFTIPDESENIAEDTGGDELYGEEGGSTATGQAITDGANVLGSVKRVDGTASPVYVRVRVADNANINYFEEDPVRTIYVKKPGDTDPLFAFSYKSILEGQTLEFSTTTSGATDEAYRITIDSEYTYSNAAIAEYIPAVPADEGSDGNYLTEIEELVDFNFTDGPTEPNPLNSAKYLQVDHRDTASSDEYVRMYSYAPQNGWLLYDSRNTQQQFDTLEKGKGYWGKMDLESSVPAGLVLGSPSITSQDYIDSGITEGWNLLAFNASNNPDIRTTTTGFSITIGAAGTITLKDVSGNHSLAIPLASAGAPEEARAINQAIKVAKINGTIPKTFNIVAIPTGANDIALLSDEKFQLGEDVDATITAVTTLAGDVPLNADTLDDLAGTDITGGTEATAYAMSKYGEYALIAKAENDGYAQLDIKCQDGAVSNIVAPTSAGIAGATCIDASYALDLDYDGVIAANDAHVLLAADEPFEIRDHTFTRVFDFTATAGDGVLKFENATPDIADGTSITLVGGTYEVSTLTINSGVLISDTSNDTSVDINGTTVNVDDGDIMVNVIGKIAAASYDGWTVTGTDVGAGTVEFTAKALGDPDLSTGLTFNAGSEPDTNWGGSVTVDTAGAAAVDVNASTAAATIATDGSFNLNGEIVAVGEKLIFRTIGAGTNEFKVLETADGIDNLTPSSSNDAAAKGAISHVYSPNSIVKADLENTLITQIADGDPGVIETVTQFGISVTTPINGGTTIALDPYNVEAADLNNSTAVYTKLESWINDQLDSKSLDTIVSIADTGSNGTSDFDANLTWTGTDVNGTTLTVTGAASLTVTDPSASGVDLFVGVPKVGNGDITQDLKYNFVLSPNYVLDGPLYEMKDAGFTAEAMVTGTMNLTTDTMVWDSIDLTRKPSEWLDSQDYNLFTVDNAAGYWTYLTEAADNPLSFDSANFVANYSQHFDVDGTTYNNVAGGIYVNIYGIDYNFDGQESARVVAVVGGSNVELSRQSGDTYVGQISSRELKEMVEGKEYDIQVVVADGIGNRIDATSTGVVVDYKAPSKPEVTITRGTMEIAEDVNGSVVKYYLFSGDIPAVNTAQAVDDEFTELTYNLCSLYTNKDTTYDLKLVALDGDTLRTSNVSDAYMIDDYVSIFSNVALITDSATAGDTVPGIASSYYDSTCQGEGDLTGYPYPDKVDGFSATAWTNNSTVKVAYTPIEADTANPFSVFVDGGDSNGNVALITYPQNYEGQTVFIQIGDILYSYVLPGDISDVNDETTPIDLSVMGTILPSQSLDVE
jgi:hypothetical protein